MLTDREYLDHLRDTFEGARITGNVWDADLVATKLYRYAWDADAAAEAAALLTAVYDWLPPSPRARKQLQVAA